MSKSIYEEVLEKIDVEFDAWDRAEHLELFELVEQTLAQALKQEKLLELYKRLITIKDDMLSCSAIVDDDYYDIEKIETHFEQQIKVLEELLK